MASEYAVIILKGALFTLVLGLSSLFFSLCLGFIFAYFKLSRRKLLSVLATLYTSIIRGVPELVLILLFFYGIQIIVNSMTDSITILLLNVFPETWFNEDFSIFININPFITGVIAIGLVYGAYMAETFRGAILNIDNGQIEAAQAFGMNTFLRFRRIVFPQVVFYGLSSFTNNWLVLLKATSLVSIIGLNDMVRQANFAAASTKQAFLFYAIICFIFLFFTTISLWLLKKLKNRYHFINA